MLHGLGVLLAPVRVPFIVEVLREELGPGRHHALDLGAGGGLLAEALSETGLSVVAMDPSLPSLRAGRAHSLAVGSPVKYVGGDGERLPFADGEFDAVVCMEVLEHVEDAGAVVTEAARVLRPGGVFLYSARIAPSSTESVWSFSLRSFSAWCPVVLTSGAVWCVRWRWIVI
jgi:2-polyprenyl-3-methyl-5-hydroxy-6-metoxy-1,4-benzoquinol methylase